LDICGEKVAMVSLNDSWLTAGDKKSIWLGRIGRMPASGVCQLLYIQQKWDKEVGTTSHKTVCDEAPASAT